MRKFPQLCSENPRREQELSESLEPAHSRSAQALQGKDNPTHLFEGFLHLHQRVPVGDGLAGVRQHLVPVVSAQPLGVDAHAANPDDLVVAHPEEEQRSSTITIHPSGCPNLPRQRLAPAAAEPGVCPSPATTTSNYGSF